MINQQDNLYSDKRKHVVDFAFDNNVVSVFPDMIRRSVPGYETVIGLLGVIADDVLSEGSVVYDLGCSLGASTLAILDRIQNKSVQFNCVDNSADMIEQCETNLSTYLQAHPGNSTQTLILGDIQDQIIENADLVVLNFTLQFIPLDRRKQLVNKIYQGLNEGGVLVLSEKCLSTDPYEEARMTALHQHFKRANGYSDLEISQKRTALEKIMIPESVDTHLDRLRSAGFDHPIQWFKCFNFSSYLAAK